MTKKKEKLWIFTFEYAGIIKVGGLGEVPANQTKYLKNDYDITVFIPSHGQIESLKTKMEIEKLPIIYKTQLKLGKTEGKERESSYEIIFHKCKLKNIKIILLSGGNSLASRYLDDDLVYNPSTFSEKLLLFSKGMRFYVNSLIEQDHFALPNIIHMHDYHTVIPFIGVKQELAKKDLIIPSLITIHLLTWPIFNIEYYYECGIEKTPIKVLFKDGFKSLTIEEIFDLCKESQIGKNKNNTPSIEKIGAIISDLVTTVSRSYLFSDIIPNLGKDLIEFKTDYVWDGCDWNYYEIKKNIIDKLGDEIRDILNISKETEITRDHMKKYLLNYKINHLSQSPLIKSRSVIEIIDEISNSNPFIKNENVLAFDETGPLVISTGRISKQKGFDIIFKAIPDVIKSIPNVKFLLLLLPTEYSLKEIKEYAQVVKKYPKNIRIIFGVASEIFQIVHIAADAYCALSRWEPFGIIALEAMASKLPIIATKVGGLQETVIDFREDSKNGTGILVEKDNPNEFAKALIWMLKLAEISEKVKSGMSLYDSEIKILINEIQDPIIQNLVLNDANYYEKIKENCYKRVINNFRWKIVTQKQKELYRKVINQ